MAKFCQNVEGDGAYCAPCLKTRVKALGETSAGSQKSVDLWKAPGALCTCSESFELMACKAGA